jgi:tRNA(fMet)-specific endonuclease VapC
MRFLFDSNIILHYIRQSELSRSVEVDLNPFSPENECWYCIVSKGEMRSIAIQNQWGIKKRQRLEDFFEELIPADVFAEDVINKYAEIDAYSQNKLPGKSLGHTARNMGKNDLWIAATASVLDAVLITTDMDFNHLEGAFLRLRKLDT